MQGLEISNALTVGTGEGASVKVENTTTLTVKAEFSQTQERETTDTDTEVDTTEVDVSAGRSKRVFQAKWESKFKETSEKHMICKPLPLIFTRIVITLRMESTRIQRIKKRAQGQDVRFQSPM